MLCVLYIVSQVHRKYGNQIFNICSFIFSILRQVILHCMNSDDSEINILLVKVLNLSSVLLTFTFIGHDLKLEGRLKQKRIRNSKNMFWLSPKANCGFISLGSCWPHAGSALGLKCHQILSLDAMASFLF